MRLFIALDFNEHQDFFHQAQALLSQDHGKLSLLDTFHMTLKFLGEVDNPQMVMQQLEAISPASFDLTLHQLGCFPTPSSARVIWVGARESGDLLRLQRAIDLQLKQFSPEKGFKAHITIARVRFLSDSNAFKESFERWQKAFAAEQTVKISAFHLIKSDLSSGKPVYTVMKSYPLA